MHICLGLFELFLHLQVQQQWRGLISGMGRTFRLRSLSQARELELCREWRALGALGGVVWPEEEALGVGDIADEELYSDWGRSCISLRTSLVVLTVLKRWRIQAASLCYRKLMGY